MSSTGVPAILLDAIEQLRPTLPTLLGPDYIAFKAQLDAAMAEKSEENVWKTFEDYPAANKRLEIILEGKDGEETVTRGGLGLFGTPLYSTVHSSSLFFRCDKGLHDVQADHVQERDAQGIALCPQHGVAMQMVDTKRDSSH